jgi:hypothetical protein
MFYNRTTVSFPHSRAVLNTMQGNSSNFSTPLIQIENLVRLDLNIGPAKTNNVQASQENEEALELLQARAVNLRFLNLSFTYYHNVIVDELILSDTLLAILLRFGRLEGLKLRMTLPPPGPLGPTVAEEGLVENMFNRLAYIETDLNHRLCNVGGTVTSDSDTGSPEHKGNREEGIVEDIRRKLATMM